MWIRNAIKPYDGEPWAFDNGVYSDHINGRAFDEDAYLRRLDAAYAVGRPLFAVLPDIVGKGARSLAYSLAWLERVPVEWPWYIALQDGMTVQELRPLFQKFCGLFLGGTDPWKATAGVWEYAAHEAGLKFHYGRAGTARKLEHAVAIGSDSLDSAFPLWTNERMTAFADWVTRGVPQPSLWAAS